MKPLTLSTIAEYCGGSLLQGMPAQTAGGVSTDTRTIEAGDVFVALTGERFDGHDYLEEAAAKGAGAVVVSKLPPASDVIECAIIIVKDTLVALQSLAKRYRDTLDLKVVVVTGSSGKTSTKDLIDAVLSRSFSVNATRGNLNNHIGLPLTMLGTGGNDECGVWEVGMNHPGEIEMLAELASPDIGVITNVGTAHIEFMKTREAIAQEKGMLAEAVPGNGCVVLDAGDDFCAQIRARTSARVVTTGIGEGDVRAAEVEPGAEGSAFVLEHGEGRERAFVPVVGEHMVRNALLAAAVGIELGVSDREIAAGLREARLTGGRLERKEHAGMVCLDDSYNANPDSMRAALQALADQPCEGKRIAVLGAMAELGEGEAEAHRAIGRELAELGIDRLVTVGEKAQAMGEGAGEAADGGPEVLSCRDHAGAAVGLKEIAGKGDVLLFKGSRSAGMEKVLQQFLDE